MARHRGQKSRKGKAMREIFGVNVYTLPEAAKIAGLSYSRMRRAIEDGKLIANKIGQKWTVTEPNLRKYVFGEAGSGETEDEKKQNPESH